MTDDDVTRSLHELEQRHAAHHLTDPDPWADHEAPIWRTLRRINPGVFIACAFAVAFVFLVNFWIGPGR